MTILIVTHSNDNDCISMVTQAIEERGGSAFRLDTDEFPTDVQLVVQHGEGLEHCTLSSMAGKLDLRSVSAIWYRRFHPGGQLPDTMDEQLRRASVRESRATLLGMIAGLEAFRLDPLPHIRHAENKQLQLQVAHTVGLATPQTLTTNDPAAVRAFAQTCADGLIVKMLSSFAIYEGGEEQVVFTNPVAPQDLDDLGGLRLCPMTFQERVPKTLELRTTIVGDRTFTAAIDSQSSEQARHDWRRDGISLMQDWRSYDLPRDVEQRLLQLMDYFGLNYGAVDLILTPQGQHVFLEVNPVGEFFWLELSPGLPISSAIADVLLGRAYRRTSSSERAG
jgi:MvdD family ATP-grasp ribosomal peptide maturase